MTVNGTGDTSRFQDTAVSNKPHASGMQKSVHTGGACWGEINDSTKDTAHYLYILGNISCQGNECFVSVLKWA